MTQSPRSRCAVTSFDVRDSHVTSTPETLLAFDVGARRIGVAVGNDFIRHAHAAAIVRVTESDDGLAAIAKLVDEWRPERLVVGMPFSVGGGGSKPTASFARCERFVERLARRFGLPIARVDERYSSIDADTIHRVRRQAGAVKRANALDDVAAQVILQRYFDALPAQEVLV